MNTFWLKIAGIAVVVVVVLAVAGKFTGGEGDTASSPAPASNQQTPTVYDKFEEDEERLNAPIEVKSTQSESKAAPADVNAAPAQGTPVVEAKVSEEPKEPEFVKLTEEQTVEADRIWQMVVTERKMGRLPIMGFGKTVTYCRMLIERFPGSEYALKAKRVLNEIVEINDRYKRQFHITDEELDMGPYQ